MAEAKQDAQTAYKWYEAQAEGLGEDFLACLDASFQQISKNPQRFPIRFDSFRRILLRRFPYAVYFDFDDHTAYVYYIFHCSQNLAKLMKRLQGT